MRPDIRDPRNRLFEHTLRAYKWLREIHAGFDAAQRVLETDIGVPICVPNCGVCCQHNVVPMMTIEAMHAISIFSGKGQPKLSEKIALAEGWLLEQHKGLTVYEGMPFGWVSPRLRDEWMMMSGTQCPFLDAHMGCSIWQARPIVCRAYGVTRDSVDETGQFVCPRKLGKGESLTRRHYIPAPLLRQDIKKFKEYCKGLNPIWITRSMVPSIIYRTAAPEKFANLVMHKKVASAKLIGTDLDTSLLWQEQLNLLRAGQSPDLVAATN